MANKSRIWIDGESVRIGVTRWGEAESRKSPFLLVHGTGFVSEVWDEVASALAADHTVYALDRRGHGSSDKPESDRYHFLDFAMDVCAVIEALGLDDVVGVGHSAGGTDLLLAAKLMPQRISRLFVMEPTVMDPRIKQERSQLSAGSQAIIRRILHRCCIFESASAAFRRFRATPAFEKWSEPSLRAYIQYGFEPFGDDGRLRLLCRPEIEAAMLRPIFEALEQIYTGDERGNPFLWLSELRCPVCISISERSDHFYKEMASRAMTMLPIASQLTFGGAGHCVAQEAPELVFKAIESFAAAD